MPGVPAGTPGRVSGMPQSSSRNHRNNPYTMDRMFAQVHHSAAGAIFRFRTELAALTAAIIGTAELARAVTLGWPSSS